MQTQAEHPHLVKIDISLNLNTFFKHLKFCFNSDLGGEMKNILWHGAVVYKHVGSVKKGEKKKGPMHQSVSHKVQQQVWTIAT